MSTKKELELAYTATWALVTLKRDARTLRQFLTADPNLRWLFRCRDCGDLWRAGDLIPNPEEMDDFGVDTLPEAVCDHLLPVRCSRVSKLEQAGSAATSSTVGSDAMLELPQFQDAYILKHEQKQG